MTPESQKICMYFLCFEKVFADPIREARGCLTRDIF